MAQASDRRHVLDAAQPAVAAAEAAAGTSGVTSKDRLAAASPLNGKSLTDT
jgi:hypothetical protein